MLRDMKRLLSLALTLASTPLWAADPEIINAQAQQVNGAWRLDVTLAHPDTGWDHYADGWRVLDMEGT